MRCAIPKRSDLVAEFSFQRRSGHGLVRPMGNAAPAYALATDRTAWRLAMNRFSRLSAFAGRRTSRRAVPSRRGRGMRRRVALLVLLCPLAFPAAGRVIGAEDRSRLSDANQPLFAAVGRLTCVDPRSGIRG